MSKVDLHIHSIKSSDGELTVSGILGMCKTAGMKLVSITDHNSVQGTCEALEIVKKGNITKPAVLSGVELDSSYKGRFFHILGYGFDASRREYSEIEKDILNQEKTASKERIHLFQKTTGIPLDTKAILDAANGGIVAGELIGEHAMAWENAATSDVLKPYRPGGEKSDMPFVRIYWDFFAPGKPAYIPVEFISLPDAIKLIHDTGGIAVLAHPGHNIEGDFNLLDDIIAEGIDGIEVYSSYHTPSEAARFLDIARQKKLLVSCGSDFHGKTKPNIPLGGHGSLLDDEDIINSFHLKLAQFAG
jgi:predicted metal-dependent phosphoesterase TrpH